MFTSILRGLLSFYFHGQKKQMPIVELRQDWEKTKALIKQHEGLRFKPYKDTLGNLTIGYGRALELNPLTQQEADFLFESDFNKHLELAEDNISFFHKLTPARKAVLVDMTFNLGIKKLLKFDTTLSLIEQGKYEEASKNMLKTLWAKQVKNRAVRLSKMIATGEFE